MTSRGLHIFRKSSTYLRDVARLLKSYKQSASGSCFLYFSQDSNIPRIWIRVSRPGKPLGVSFGAVYMGGGTECSNDKNCPALAGTPVERPRIPLCRDGTKNVSAKFFPNKRNGTIKRYIHAWRDPV